MPEKKGSVFHQFGRKTEKACHPNKCRPEHHKIATCHFEIHKINFRGQFFLCVRVCLCMKKRNSEKKPMKSTETVCATEKEEEKAVEPFMVLSDLFRI